MTTESSTRDCPGGAHLRHLLGVDGRAVWLRVGALFDGTNLLRDAHLVYDAGQILHVGVDLPPRAVVRAGQIGPDHVLGEFTLIPGLIEAHAHLFLEGGQEDPVVRSAYLKLDFETLLARAEARLARILRLGVIGVRDAGDRNGIGLALQRSYHSAGRGAMPYLDSPGAAIHHQGRYGAFMGHTIEADGSIEEAVAGRVREGAHRIKVLATGIINFQLAAVTSPPQLSVEELMRAARSARAHRRQTFAHCSGNEGVTACIEARIDSIEHGFFIDDDQLARMRDLDIAWVPTFAPVQFQADHAARLGWNESVRSGLRRILDRHAASLAHAATLGVRIVAGSDAGSQGVPHGHGFLRELEVMEQAGLTPLQVLRAATAAGAERLGFAENFGALRVGTKPRFLLTAAPLLDGIRHLRKPLTIVFDGVVYTGGDDPSLPGL